MPSIPNATYALFGKYYVHVPHTAENAHRYALSIPADCATRAVLGHVTNKWGTLVLLGLADGTRRWSELRRALDGVSEKMLAQCLQALVSDGFILREQKPTMPPHVEYSLTPAGREVTELLIPLFERIATHTGELATLITRAGGPRGAREAT